MTDPLFPPSAELAAQAHVDRAGYDAMYRASVDDPNAFWAGHGRRIDWITPYIKGQRLVVHARATCMSAGSRTAP